MISLISFSSPLFSPYFFPLTTHYRDGYGDHSEDVDHFYPPASLRQILAQGITQEHPQSVRTRSLPADIPIDRGRTHCRRISDFDDTWSKHYGPAEAAGEEEDSSAQASPPVTRQVSIRGRAELQLLFDFSPFDGSPSKEEGASRAEPGDGDQTPLVGRDLVGDGQSGGVSDEESVYGDAMSRKTSIVSDLGLAKIQSFGVCSLPLPLSVPIDWQHRASNAFASF